MGSIKTKLTVLSSVTTNITTISMEIQPMSGILSSTIVKVMRRKLTEECANQFGSWPFGRAGWCAGQDVKQWTYDITDWVDNSSTNNLRYRGLFNGQEYVPQDTNGGGREIRANIWLVWYDQTELAAARAIR